MAALQHVSQEVPPDTSRPDEQEIQTAEQPAILALSRTVRAHRRQLRWDLQFRGRRWHHAAVFKRVY